MAREFSPQSHSELKVVLLCIVGGLAFFFLSVLSARRWVPEWRTGEIPDKKFFLNRYQELATREGVVPVPGSTRTGLRPFMKDHPYLYDLLGREATDWLRRERRPLMVEVSQLIDQGSESEAWLSISFSLDGKPWSALWSPRRLMGAAFTQESSSHRPISELMKRICIWEGDVLQSIPHSTIYLTSGEANSISGYQLPQFTYSLTSVSTAACVRSVGTAQDAHDEIESLASGRYLSLFVLPALALLSSVILFLLLGIRGRLSFSVGLFLAVASLLIGLLIGVRITDTVKSIAAYVGAGYFAGILFLVWSSGESLMRRSESGLFQGLDSLRRGRFHHSEARQLLMGFASGAVLGGVKLIFSTIADTVPGIRPESLSVSLQHWSVNRTFFIDGVMPLAFVVLAEGIRKSIPAIRSPLVTVVLAALFTSLVMPWVPSYFSFVSAAAVAYVLAQTMESQGILAALISSVVSVLLPLAVFSLQHPTWLPGYLWGSLAVLLMILAAGRIGWLRKGEGSEEPLKTFISYSHCDMELRRELGKFLAPLEAKGLIRIWNDDLIYPGGRLTEIEGHLNQSDIVLLLISVDSLNSEPCQQEHELALSLTERGLATAIPVILRDSEWQETALGRLKALPADGKPVTTWSNRDKAFLDIARGVRRAAENRRREKWRLLRSAVLNGENHAADSR